MQYRFADPDLLDLALRHRSHVYANAEEGITSNERLEFLGDAILDLVVTEDLFCRHTDKREGELTQIKSLLVSKAVLAQKARDIGIGNFLHLNHEEDLAGGRGRTSILGDAFEAVLGAIYLDGGVESARVFVTDHLLKNQDEITSDGSYINFKSALLEHTQSVGHGHPRYLVHAEDGPDHRKTFTVEVLVAGDRVGLGRGRSKKEAQQMAAREALEKLGVE
ncbi:ribonuclease III [bacterium]|nr:ribonuclease III [bacterium]